MQLQTTQALKPTVIAVIVTYNPVISQLASNLCAHALTGAAHIIIVDNASLNHSEIEGLVENSGAIPADLVSLPENAGIGAAQNVGMRRAMEKGCSHVILFDQDSSPSPCLVDLLLADESNLMAAGIKVGAIGPSFTDLRTGSYYPMIRIVGPMLTQVRNECGSAPVEVSVIIASGSLIRTEVLNRVGAMNEDFFMDCVDLEWCLRASSQGFKIFVSTKAVMTHMIGDTRKRSLGREVSIHSPLRRYYMARNWILLARLPWVPAGLKVREVFFVLTRVPVFLFSVHFKWEYVKFIAKGICHGISGRGGSYQS